jgi:hypothetical protein
MDISEKISSVSCVSQQHAKKFQCSSEAVRWEKHKIKILSISMHRYTETLNTEIIKIMVLVYTHS